MFEDLMARYNGAEGGPTGQWQALMRGIGGLVADRGGLPRDLQARLIQVNASWNAGSADDELLRSVKLECWAYLKAKHGNSTTVADQEDRAIRAMLALVEPAGDAEAACDMADWVAEMLSPQS
jgi:hypothetical protein